MDVELAHLRVLRAVISEGTFEAAARVLHVTPSALSQRIKALENAAGRVLLIRTKPVRMTPSGEAMLRLARQVETLVSDASLELGAGSIEESLGERAAMRRMVVPVAVNADSLATWVLPTLAPLAGEVCFDIHREDQEHTVGLLRDGSVMAAITADAEPVPGCAVTRLGAMRYRPMAAPGFAERWFSEGLSARAFAAAPVVVFDRKDDLQHRYLRRRTRAPIEPPPHHVPSTADYLAAVVLGFGWGMLPDLQSAAALAAGELVEVDPDGNVDVVLYWQQWKLRAPSLDRVAAAVIDAARRQLIQSAVTAAAP